MKMRAILTNRMWFSVVCPLIDNDIRHHSGQNVVDSRGAANISVKEKFYNNCQDFRALVDASSVVQTLIDNGKLANQIARLETIVVKMILAFICAYFLMFYS